MKLKVIKRYSDAERRVTARIGEVFEADKKRAEMLIRKGYAIAIEEEKPVKPKKNAKAKNS